jgi:hypothetical protein
MRFEVDIQPRGSSLSLHAVASATMREAIPFLHIRGVTQVEDKGVHTSVCELELDFDTHSARTIAPGFHPLTRCDAIVIFASDDGQSWAPMAGLTAAPKHSQGIGKGNAR